MKKTVSLLLIVSVLLAFGVYAAADNNGITTVSDEPETASGEEMPEWDMSISPEITEDIRALFDRAMEKRMGVEYTPVAVLGVIDSTYCILCKAAVVYPEPDRIMCLCTSTRTGCRTFMNCGLRNMPKKKNLLTELLIVHDAVLEQ